MNKHIIGLLLLFTITTVFFACSDRGNNIVYNDYTESIGFYTHDHEFDEELGFCMFNDVGKLRHLNYKVYVPPGYKGPGEGEPYPVLYLLSPYGETEMFYIDHSLKVVADQMISSGEIKPMIIVCVNGYNGYGGSFFGNSHAGGRYVDAIASIQGNIETGSMIDFVDGIFNTISDGSFPGKGRSNRAISGVGMGGYGAMRMAVTYSENFSSVSAVSAPLDFDGATGTGGFIPLFSQILDDLDTTYAAMDTSYNDPLRTMMFAAAATFSPHDTEYVNPTYYPWDWRDPTGPQVWNSDDTLQITDMLTYFEPFGPISPMKYHLPFYDDTTVAGVNEDYTYQPIWDLWLENNIQSILADHAGALDTTSVLLITTADAKYNFYQQTLDFSNYLTNVAGVTHDFNTYSGYDGYDATGERFFYDILPDILKYHSDKFELTD
ncbi:MAG: esterase family protein [candidate division Zixibacteria bacterium]|nr:esterase family protein [candidate division Zixibacteria bacterium]